MSSRPAVGDPAAVVTDQTARALALTCDHLRPLLAREVDEGNVVTLCHPTRQGTIIVLGAPLMSPLRAVAPPLVESPAIEPTARREVHCTEHRHWLLCRG